ncbi:MAG: M56 family metallopeptidase [Bryobacteraceae bacterium]
MNTGQITFSWALLHFLWQGALLALGLAAALRVVDARRARLRYGLACLTMMLLAAAVPATWVWLSTPPPVVYGAEDGAAYSGEIGTEGDESAPAASTADRAVAWIPMAWAAGVLLFSLRMLGAWAAVRRVTVRARGAGSEWDELAGRIGVRRAVRLLESAAVDGPWHAGVWKPVIVVPVGMLTQMAPAAVEAILLHELAHIRRYDYLVNLLQGAVESALFYHPAVWWVSAAMRREREHCCDDAVLEVTGDRVAYARALLDLETSRADGRGVEWATAARGGDLKARIERMLAPAERNASAWAPAMAGAALILVLLSAVAGQTTATEALAAAPQAAPAATLTPSPSPQVEAEAQFAVRPSPSPEPSPVASPVVSAAASPAALPMPLPAPSPAASQVAGATGGADASPLTGKDAEIARLRAELDKLRAEANQDRSRRRSTKRKADVEKRKADGERRKTDSDKRKAATEERNKRRAEERKVKREQRLAKRKTQLSAGLRSRSRSKRESRSKSKSSPYQKWADEDAAYLLTPEERARFEALTSNTERQSFIDQFWKGRDKEEHYRRIAYANQRFGRAGTPGWRTDRGKLYIQKGPPDEIEVHPGKDEAWRYRESGNNRDFRFDGEGRLLKDR